MKISVLCALPRKENRNCGPESELCPKNYRPNCTLCSLGHLLNSLDSRAFVFADRVRSTAALRRLNDVVFADRARTAAALQH
jgi:hypothetical protein